MTTQLPLTLPPERWSEAGPWYRYFAALVVATAAACPPGGVTISHFGAKWAFLKVRLRWFRRMGKTGGDYVPGGDVLTHCRAVVEATEGAT